MKIIGLPPTWSGRAVIVTGADDAQAWLTPAQLAVAASFPRKKRRDEWISSRIAEAILRQRGAAGSNVSYSHSGPYGAAAVDSALIGIDVERVRTISENAAHLFLSDSEISAMRACGIPDRMLHFWTAKEALWKQAGGRILTLKRIPLRLEQQLPNGLRFDGVETYAADDFIAALTTENRQPATRA